MTTNHSFARFSIVRRSVPVLSALVVSACASAGTEGATDPTPPAAVVGPATGPVASAARPVTAGVAPASSPLHDPLAPGPEPAPSASYQLGPGDQIDVSVFGADTFSGSYRVAEDGDISIPLLGPVPASGLTGPELEEALEARLKATYMRDPHVTIQVGEMHSHGVSVVGAVTRPGVYQIPSATTLLEVLAMAEGLAPEAGGTAYVIRRSARREGALGGQAAEQLIGTDPTDPVAADSALVRSGGLVPVDLGALLESGATTENVMIHPGDIVQVRPAGLVYVVGEVNSPGGFVIPPGRPMTILQALAMAQGLGGTAAAGRAVIVRDHEDGQREEIPVDLEAVLKGSEPPPMLVARDVLFVPKNQAKSFALGVVDALVRMVTLRGLVY